MGESPETGDPARRAVCLNCGAALAGQYCARCGQRARARLISLWELVRDAFGDLFELDSRLWRTLIPLMARPGYLTAEYLRGRRVHFMPPFRSYLVLSLLFFVVAFFDPRQDFSLLFEPATESGSTAEPATDAPEPAEVPGVDIPAAGGTRCTFSDDEMSDMPAWLSRRLTPERLRQLCERFAAGGSRAFLDRMLENVPIGLLVLLPVIAAVLKLLYPLSRRYYVEHLLFLVHFHAFLFLALCLQVLVSRLGELLPTAGDVVVSLVIPFYIPVYLYKAQRRVYGQGHPVTILKYLVLLIAYFVSFGMMLGIVALVAALSL